MSDDLLVKHCSPTMAGIKTGSMFSCEYSSADELKKSIRLVNKKLTKKGLRIVPLKITNNRALLYAYRPVLLCKDLDNSVADNLLKECGYCCENPCKCVMHLVKRMRNSSDFPHEVGLFLGYPPEDVQGFITHKANFCKLSGCWKVYGDEKKAQRLFAKYKKCTKIYCKHYAYGSSIEKLTVAL